jgi:hypothetical protein
MTTTWTAPTVERMPTRQPTSRPFGEKSRRRTAARDKGLDEVVPSHGYTPERTRNLRWIYVHMIEEYARHNGHANLIRERIDGAVGD